MDDLDEAVKRALKAGGKLDREIQRGPKSNLANLSDPSGNGIDLIERAEEVGKSAVVRISVGNGKLLFEVDFLLMVYGWATISRD